MKLALSLLVPVALLVVTQPAAAAFRCTDKAGKTVYMERPCSTYGYKTEKEVKDPPKGDGTMRTVPSGQSLVGSPSERSGGARRMKVPMQCGTDRVMCIPGDTVICGGAKRVCDSD